MREDNFHYVANYGGQITASDSPEAIILLAEHATSQGSAISIYDNQEHRYILAEDLRA